MLSLVLLNALAVTSITTERDLAHLDLLLVTDLTPSEFIFGKLWGVFYVAKEMLLLPLAICIYLWWADAITFENLLYLIGGLAVMDVFVATLASTPAWPTPTAAPPWPSASAPCSSCSSAWPPACES